MIVELMKHLKKDYLGYIGYEVLMILVLVALRLVYGGEIDISTVVMIGYIVTLMVHANAGSWAFRREFSIGVSMGITRRKIVWCLETVNLLGILLLSLEAYFICILGKLLAGASSAKLWLNASSGLILMAGMAVVAAGVEMLLQSVILKFGMKAYYVFIFGLSGCFIIYGKIMAYPKAERAMNKVLNVFAEAGRSISIAFWAGLLAVIVGILAAISWGILRKQQVEGI